MLNREHERDAGGTGGDDDFVEAVPLGRAHPRKSAMLAALAQTGNVSAAARAAGIARSTHYEWLGNDHEYREAVDEAMEEAADVLEAVARKRAIVGSDTLLIFLLKAIRPAKFRERYEVEHKEPQTVVEFFRQAAMKVDAEERREIGG